MRIEQPPGSRGSLKWLQRLVQHRPDLLDAPLRASGALPAAGALTWLSPLAADAYAEYRDEAFLRRISQAHLNAPLKSFWPRRGPQWDALASDGQGRVFLFEAKAHAAEMASTCQAGAASRAMILASCEATKRALNASPDADWLTGHYQYANRLAHWHFLREQGVDAWLVFLYFTGDTAMGGPDSEAAWRPHIEAVHRHLGLQAGVTGVVAVFQATAPL